MQVSTIYSRLFSKKTLRKFDNSVIIVKNELNKLIQTFGKNTEFDFLQHYDSYKKQQDVLKMAALASFAIYRDTGLILHDSQITGALCLNEGLIVEMRTGEGKTLTVVAGAILQSMKHPHVHVITANSYLAQRDSLQMRSIYEMVGLSCSFVDAFQSITEKQEVYASSIVYGVGHEFGFDYLRDNLVKNKNFVVQNGFYSAIVDEVDSVLIDDAKTPMILSKEGEDSSDFIKVAFEAIKFLKLGEDVAIQLKEADVFLTEAGFDKVESFLKDKNIIAKKEDLYGIHNHSLLKQIHNSVKASFLFKNNKDYTVENGEIILVDVGTGRKMYGRRLEQGLHEAIEAKENLFIKPGSLTQAFITYQNYFKLYQALSGLSGTVMTDSEEFAEVYGKNTINVPPHKPLNMVFHPDKIYAKKLYKYAAILDELKSHIKTGQPCLVGCGSVRDARLLSSLAEKEGIVHKLLTADHIAEEAEIISDAGKLGAITIATNMAGRGSDIPLGGHDGIQREAVLKLGGLKVLVSERNFLRRVDNQFAGRAGRQGDPGEVLFIMSLEDDLFKGFANEAGFKPLFRAAADSDTFFEGKMVTRFVDAAQKSYSMRGLGSRLELTKYDDVAISQRNAVFGLRQQILADPIVASQQLMSSIALNSKIWMDEVWPNEVSRKELDIGILKAKAKEDFRLNPPFLKWIFKEELTKDEISEQLALFIKDNLAEGNDEQISTWSTAFLNILDNNWVYHLTQLEELKQGAQLKSTSGLNPLYIYHKDAFDLFSSFIKSYQYEAFLVGCAYFSKTKIGAADSKDPLIKIKSKKELVKDQLAIRWIERNELCPCGSGDPYKKCHGKLQ